MSDEGADLAGARVGTVPIVWNDMDRPGGGPRAPWATILDEVARLGYAGCQLGPGFPKGTVLAAELRARGISLAEAYAAIACTPDGPVAGALEAARVDLAVLHEAGGDVLVTAVDGGRGRAEWTGRAADPRTPRLTEQGWSELASLLEALAGEARELGHPVAFHAHAGTYVETPDELDRLASLTDPALLGLCIDTGHVIAGGGDPVAELRRFGERVVHVHLKDVDGAVLEGLRTGVVADLGAAIRARLFTELGAGVLDLSAVLRALAERDYDGWLMVEQDSSWLPPSEATAIGRRVLDFAMRELSRAAVAA